MANRTLKLALNAASYPFLAKQASRSVVVPGQDIAPQTREAYFGNFASVDFNIPQLVYCENVVPIAKGLQAVGFLEEYAAHNPPVTDFDRLIVIRDSFGDNAIFSPGRGKNYVYTKSNKVWTSYSPFVFNANYDIITYGYVVGRTLIFYERTKCVEFNPGGPSVDTLVLTLPQGYAVSDIRGNSGASNYHILFSDMEIFWSSLIDPLDFATVDDGAGRQIPTDLRGQIVAVRPISGGFLIYTTENIVAASFTNDASRPFLFREVQNSGGTSSIEQIAGEANAQGHYVYNSGGVQIANLQQARTVFPEVADFLTMLEMEVWNATTKSIDVINVEPGTIRLMPKMQYLGNRYLIISYGADDTIYKYALLYDTVLERWGKLKLDHIDVQELPIETLGFKLRYFQLPKPYDEYDVAYEDLFAPAAKVGVLRQNYGFLQPDGTVYLLSLDPAPSWSGVAIFGRLQFVRDNFITLHGVELEGLFFEQVPTISVLASDTGTERDTVAELELVTNGTYEAEYTTRLTAKNLDLAVEGGFQLTGCIITAGNHGSR